MGLAPFAVVSFEAPRPGGQAFADAFKSTGIYSERYEFHNDIVPHLPPTGMLSKFLTGVITLSDMTTLGLSKMLTTLVPLPLPKPIDFSLLSLLYPRASHHLNYVSPGTLHYINQDKTISAGDSIGLQNKRTAGLIQNLLQVQSDALKAGIEAGVKEVKAGMQPSSFNLIRPVVAADFAYLSKHFGGLLKTLADMHAIGCGSGHMSAICEKKRCE